MKKNILIIILSILLVLSLGFIIYNIFIDKDQCYKPVLSVIGDVNKVLKLNSYQNMKTVKIDYKNEKLEVIKLKEIIELSTPFSEGYNILFSAVDGMQVLIPGENLDKCYLNLSSQRGWEAINLNHPVSSNVKYINEIIVISNQHDIESNFSVINRDKNLFHKTVGQMLAGKYIHYPHFEGSSSFKNDDIIYKDSVFNVKKIFRVEDILDTKINLASFIIAEKGVTEFYRGGKFVLQDNRIDYMDPEGKVNIKNCKGMVINPPSRRNSDVYHDVLHYLDSDRKVLIILLDGFGFHQYQHAIANGYAPFLAEYKDAQKAVSVYKPVTNAGLAATLTGTGPERNGVYSRKQKELKTIDVFEKVNELGGESLYIEGYIKKINTSIEPVLNPDLNGNGTDDEVFNTAIKNLDKNYDLIYVHFHGIDDFGHNYGDLSNKTMEKIKETDSYLKQLITKWSGKVIITADHGMHTTNDGGDHGSVRYEDLIIPYILAEGGK